MFDSQVVVVSAKRSPIGNFLGQFSTLTSSELTAPVIKSIVEECKLDVNEVDEVILGHVLTTGLGQNAARQSSVKAGIPYSVPASSVSMVCGSSMRAIISGYESIMSGNSHIMLTGGQESMSQSMHAIYMRKSLKVGSKPLVDTMLSDGLTDSFLNCHMGDTAECLVEKFKVTRVEQDTFATESQARNRTAVENEKFVDEIVPITVPKDGKQSEMVISRDEFPKPQTTVEGLSKLRPSFKSTTGDGSVTAGNAAGLNDGAAVLALMSLSKAKSLGLNTNIRIVSTAIVGCNPKLMGIGPVEAIRKACRKADWNLQDIDLFEINEAFAVQVIAVIRELSLNPCKVNVNGGSIALGHPIGASGARIAVTLIHEMKRAKVRRGVASLCVGGGMGLAICIENSIDC